MESEEVIAKIKAQYCKYSKHPSCGAYFWTDLICIKFGSMTNMRYFKNATGNCSYICFDCEEYEEEGK